MSATGSVLLLDRGGQSRLPRYRHLMMLLLESPLATAFKRAVDLLAEEERFELPDSLHRRRFSKPLP
jgi:hypothetical protein